MRLKYLPFIVATLMGLEAFCQLPFERVLPDRIDFDQVPKTEEIRAHVWETTPENYRDEYPRKAIRFADQNALLTDHYLTSGFIIDSWNPLNEYVNAVFDQIIPNEYKSNPFLEAHVMNDASYNAFMLASGQTFVNLGVLAEAPDEATLAAILAHELGHYVGQHSVEQFVRREDGEFAPYLFAKNRSFQRHSQSNELESDSFSLEWLKEAGYDLKGIENALNIIGLNERNRLLRSTQTKLVAGTHPLSVDRRANVAEFIEKNQNDSAKKFIVGEDAFYSFRNDIRILCLKQLLMSHQYSSCVETAFKYHLQDLSNTAYYCYIMEGIRRAAYGDAQYWNQEFVTFRYFDERLNPEGKIDKIPLNKSLFETSGYEYLKADSSAFAMYPGKMYWNGAPQFKTNEEAFNHFYSLGSKRNQAECVLSAALSYHSMPEIRNQLLTSYLQFPMAAYKAYAEALMAGTTFSSLPNERLLVFNDLRGTIRQGTTDIPLRSESSNLEDQKRAYFEAVRKELPFSEAVYMSDLKVNENRMYQKMYELMMFSSRFNVSSGERTFLHIMDPEYWMLMKHYGVNEINFLTVNYLETRKKEQTKEAFEMLLSEDFDSCFNREKCSKFMDVIFTAVMDRPESVTTARFMERDVKLNFKNASKQETINQVGYSWNKFEERKAQLDLMLKHSIEERK